MLVPGSLIGGAKYAHEGQMFARVQLKENLSEDSVGGRLIMNSQVAWLSEVTATPVPTGELRKVRAYCYSNVWLIDTVYTIMKENIIRYVIDTCVKLIKV